MAEILAVDGTAKLTATPAHDGSGLVVSLGRVSGASVTQAAQGVFSPEELRELFDVPKPKKKG